MFCVFYFLFVFVISLVFRVFVCVVIIVLFLEVNLWFMFLLCLGIFRVFVLFLVRVCMKDLIGFLVILWIRYVWFDYVCLYFMINVYFCVCFVFYSVSNCNNFWYVIGLSVEYWSVVFFCFISFFVVCIMMVLFYLSFVFVDLFCFFVFFYVLDEYNVVNEICVFYICILLLIVLLYFLGVFFFYFCNCFLCEMDIEDNFLVLFIFIR